MHRSDFLRSADRHMPIASHSSSPVIVVGMHRSGTSFTASLMSRLGVQMGDALVPADQNNRRGYFEDQAFLDLNRRMLAAACSADLGGHPDWGWNESEQFDESALEAFRDEARCLVARCRLVDRHWGWKDPRTTMLLDFWQSIIPDARYLMVYRHPWDVADSMQRLAAPIFAHHPHYADRIWQVYNRRMLDFLHRHPERCLLASTAALTASPQALVALMHERFGIQLDGPLEGQFEAELFQDRGLDDPLAALHAMAWPESAQVLRCLEQAAHLPSPHAARTDAAQRGEPAPIRSRLIPGSETAPRISLITPVHNDGVYLPESLASAERSAPDGSELLLIDDGSTDPFTLRLLDRLREAGYGVIRQDNRGLSAARNRGMASARGEYLIPLDADNRIRPGYLQQAIAVLDAQPRVGVVYGDRAMFGMRNETVQVPDFDHQTLREGNYIDACAVLRKTLWQEVGGFDETLPAYEDWDLWLAASEAGWRFHHLPQVLFDYRVRPGNLSAWVKTGKHDHVLKHRVQTKRAPTIFQLPGVPRGAERLLARTVSTLRRAHSTWRQWRVPAQQPTGPDFLILGAMKAGTTSLHECLSSHPQVMPPVTKEVHYFTQHYQRGMRWYLEQLNAPAALSARLLCGEASPYYLFHPAVPARVAADCPDARLIVMLRDPVTRAISHFHHSRRLGFEPLDLEEALAREQERLAGQADAPPAGRIARDASHRHHSYQARGHYAEQLQEWLQHFQAEQILLIQSEQLFQDPYTQVGRVCDFLRIAGRPQRAIADLNSIDYDAAPPGVVASLARHFEPWNQRLAELLASQWGFELDLSLWEHDLAIRPPATSQDVTVSRSKQERAVSVA